MEEDGLNLVDCAAGQEGGVDVAAEGGGDCGRFAAGVAEG